MAKQEVLTSDPRPVLEADLVRGGLWLVRPQVPAKLPDGLGPAVHAHENCTELVVQVFRYRLRLQPVDSRELVERRGELVVRVPVVGDRRAPVLPKLIIESYLELRSQRIRFVSSKRLREWQYRDESKLHTCSLTYWVTSLACGIARAT